MFFFIKPILSYFRGSYKKLKTKYHNFYLFYNKNLHGIKTHNSNSLLLASFGLAIFKLITCSKYLWYINLCLYCILYVISLKYNLYVNYVLYKYFWLIRVLIPLHYLQIRLGTMDDIIKFHLDNKRRVIFRIISKIKNTKL